MMQNFTKLIYLSFCLFLSQTAMGQFGFTINVDGVDQEFISINTGAFGVCSDDVISAEFVLSDPLTACEALTNDMIGKVAVIDRGTCSFIDKARAAQAVGAIAVLICNNASADPGTNGLVNMGVDTNEVNDVTIPVYSASLESCIMFRTVLPANGSISPPPFDETPAEKVVWGNEPGQGDFDGGKNGWGTVTLECNGAPSELDTWKYDADGILDEGALSLGVSPGPSFCNGMMAFDSDYLDNEGRIVDANGNIDLTQQGTGPCAAPQIGELVSPIIDISGSDVAGVSLEFYQETRQLNSRYFIEYSIDGGLEYTAVEINDEIDGNAFNEVVKMTIPLPGAAGSSQLRVKFTFLGNYYYWLIDDVKIVERAANNLRVNENFFAVAPNVRVPKSQVDPINFLADIQNLGASTQENTMLSISVTDDATGTEVHSDAVNLGSIIPDSLT